MVVIFFAAGTAIVVGIGATLGVLIGGILLYIIVAIFRRWVKSL